MPVDLLLHKDLPGLDGLITALACPQQVAFMPINRTRIKEEDVGPSATGPSSPQEPALAAFRELQSKVSLALCRTVAIDSWDLHVSKGLTVGYEGLLLGRPGMDIDTAPAFF
jgi:hypothetical protein